MITIKDILTQGTNRLKRLGSTETPYLDALLLMGHTLNMSKERLIAAMNDNIWEIDAIEFGKTIEQRIKGIPVAYIIHRKEFYGLDFYVDSRVLIPRPDTEVLVETALGLTGDTGDLDLLDLCTGSGCIGISILHELRHRKYRGTCRLSLADISDEALTVSALNARTILGSEPTLIRSDLFSSIPESYDLITTNPPYLTDAQSDHPQLRARREPDLALRSGSDGLDHIRKIITDAYAHLHTGGFLIIEGGFDQGPRIRDLLTAGGYTRVTIVQDLAGHDRVVYGMRA
ncbi:MAG: peptide chain release factor N(5)-glutamine methyltransferase [Spirochaetia bacterium]|nr:peptide chain release factor N(5)-glutamine methyltransferase [Spirochaetia bacterium]MCF7941907.1 peptide chain release factor N(5)-glutamine methyltransferase [Spirochaetia bacterium]